MNEFKKTSPTYKPIEPAETPYQKAKQEWDERIGSAVIQSYNWRFVAVLSTAVSLLLLILLIISLSLGKNHVYIAEVASDTGKVINISPLLQQYQPTLAQKEYFVSQFVKLIRELPLDPVVAKQNWLHAYQFLSERASGELNDYIKKDNPLDKLGKQTITVNITDVNPISNDTLQVGWTESAINTEGVVESTQAYNGVFTLTLIEPKTVQQILSNPLGIYITDFHYSTRDANS